MEKLFSYFTSHKQPAVIEAQIVEPLDYTKFIEEENAKIKENNRKIKENKKKKITLTPEESDQIHINQVEATKCMIYYMRKNRRRLQNPMAIGKKISTMPEDLKIISHKKND
jgi:hypothetical protein